MSNAAKHRKKAAEFEQLKQIDRAIASYVRAIEESESDGEDVDVALLNKVGDLALRQGRVPDAVTYYERAVEHYATAGLFNNAIALCNKILRNAPGRSNVYFTLGRICARKGLRGDATRNFLEYASRMQQEGLVDEAMRALGEVADIMPELTEVRRLVDEHATRVGVDRPRRKTPLAVDAVAADAPRFVGDKSSNLVFLDVDFTASNGATLPTMADAPDAHAAATLASAEIAARAASITPPTVLPFIDLDAYVVAPTPSRVPSVPTPSTLEAIELVAPESEGGAADIPNASEPTPDDSSRAVSPVPIELPTLDLLDMAAPAETPFPVESIETTSFDRAATGRDVSDSELHVVETSDVGPFHLDVLDDLTLDGLELPDAHAADDQVVEAEVEHTSELTFIDEPLHTIESLSTFDAVDAVERIPVELPMIEWGPDEDQPHDEAPVGLEPSTFAPTAPEISAPPASIPTPRASASISRGLPIPALEAAIAAGAELAARAAEELPASRRPPFRLDPHDFILPGELPPLVVDDALVDAGVRVAAAPVMHAPVSLPTLAFNPVGTPRALEPIATPVASPSVEAAEEAAPLLAEREVVRSPEPEAALSEPQALQVRLTPSLPIAAVAAEAIVVADARRNELRAAVAQSPQDWALRRRLAEALFEAGQRDAGLAELEASLQGFVQSGQIADAADISELLVGVSPERVSYHQKRVELAVRLSDQQRLRLAYLDLADALVRSGEEARAQAVYVRVLEIDPLDDRARTALGSAAPPVPQATAAPEEGFVNLADWLRDDDAPASTRMRMREPVVSGDEQADFAALLRHFKEGVSRSLGDEDFESRYDLGVAFKEMGLLDDAIGEFQKALRSKTHRLPAYEALGQCFVEQGRYQVAATVLSRALHEPGLNDEQRVGVLYLLAYSCEALQRWGEARSYFQRVYATDINFRDVAARLAALEQVAT